MFRFTTLVILRLTRDCNLNCKYCFMTDKHNFKGELLSLENYQKIIDTIIQQIVQNKREGELFQLVYHGGEALMVGKKTFYQMAEYATTQFFLNDIELQLAIQTNATLLDDEFAKILRRFQIRVGMSFDGIADANKERDVKQDVFEKKFKILEDNHLEYGFIMVTGRHNINSMKESQEYLENLEAVRSYKINYAEDMFHPGEDSAVELPGEEFFEKAIKPQIDRLIETGHTYEHHTIRLIEKTILDNVLYMAPRQKSGCEALFCGAGMGMIGVNPDGTSHYCDRYNREYDETYVMNNLTDYDFLGLNQIKRAMDFTAIRHQVVLATGCDTCFARYICDGGCMAFQRSKTGENSIDTRLVCPLSKNAYSYILKRLPEIMEVYIKHQKEIKCFDRPMLEKKTMLDALDVDMHITDLKGLHTVKFTKRGTGNGQNN